MRYTVTRQRIYVLGRMWMPQCMASTVLELSSYDLGNIEDPEDRASVESWLMTHSGDFSEVIDFSADFHIGDKHVIHEWAKGEESEVAYSDTLGMED